VKWIATLVLAGLFGAAYQYAGTVHVMAYTGGWVTTLSVTSAPWLLLPFLAGWAQPSGRGSIAAGLLATAVAFVGYFALTLSPLEGVSPRDAVAGIAPLVATQAPWLIGGLLTGPLFGLLGFRWRTGKEWSSALILVAAFCLEPVACIATGRAAHLTDPLPVWIGEVAAGALLAALLVSMRPRRIARGLG
jgi:hypothetical protein